MAFISDGKTNADSYLVSKNGYTTIPLLTVSRGDNKLGCKAGQAFMGCDR